MVGIGVTSSDGLRPKRSPLYQRRTTGIHDAFPLLLLAEAPRAQEIRDVDGFSDAAGCRRLCGRRNESGPRPNAAQQTRFHISTELL